MLMEMESKGPSMRKFNLYLSSIEGSRWSVSLGLVRSYGIKELSITMKDNGWWNIVTFVRWECPQGWRGLPSLQIEGVRGWFWRWELALGGIECITMRGVRHIVHGHNVSLFPWPTKTKFHILLCKYIKNVKVYNLIFNGNSLLHWE